MKKFQIFALAALVAVGLSSCIKDVVTENNGDIAGNHKLVVKLSGLGGTRAVEAPGANNTAAIISDGYIFVFEDGKVTAAEELVVNQATTAGGQVLTNQVSESAEVFVVANLRNYADIINYTDPADVMSAAFNVNGLRGISLSNIPLATVNNANDKVFGAQAIIPDTNPTDETAGTAHVNILLSPVVSRLELGAVADYINLDAAISEPNAYLYRKGAAQSGHAFSVTGVYVLNYHPQYTISGGKLGVMVEGGTGNADLYFKDRGEWVANVASAPGIARPDVANTTSVESWTYNVASSGLPLLAIEVVGDDPDDAGDATLTKYLTVQGYMNGAAELQAFVPGVIYRINEVPFDASDFRELPDRPELGYVLTVNVEVIPWNVVTVEPIM